MHDGNGEWCYGKTCFVFAKKPRQAQKYRIKYHEGSTMEAVEADIEVAPEEDAEDESRSADREAREDREELRLEDREEENDEDDRHPLEREEDPLESGVTDGNVELDSEEDSAGDEEDNTVTVGGVLYNISVPFGQIVHAGEYR